MSRSSRVFFAALVVTFGWLSAEPARAADQRDRDAKQLYQQGKYREAAEIYTQLRDEKQSPKYLCNLGLCYAKMGHLEPAIETIKLCLATATLAPDIRTDYEGLVKKLEAQRVPAAGPDQAAVAAAPADVMLVPVQPDPAYGQQPQAQPPAAPPWGTPPAPPAGPAPAPYADPNAPYGYQPPYPGAAPPGYGVPPGGGAAPPFDQSDKPGPRGKRRVPFGSYVTGAVGVVGVALGVALVLHTQAITQELDGNHGSTAERELLRSDQSRSKSGAVGAFAVGGAGIAAAIIWAVVAPSYVKPEMAMTVGGAPVRVGMTVGPRSLALGGTF